VAEEEKEAVKDVAFSSTKAIFT